MVKTKNILFVCKHNVFRSQIAEEFFKKFNKNKHYMSGSAGLISYSKKDLAGNKSYELEKKIGKKYGLKFNGNSKSANSKILKKTDILVIVADDIPAGFFDNESAFGGKIARWKIPDVRKKDKNKEEIIEKSIIFTERKIKEFVKGLK